MRRKVIVSGPIHGPVAERAEDKGPGAAEVRRSWSSLERGGKLDPHSTADGGFRVPPEERTGSRGARPDG